MIGNKLFTSLIIFFTLVSTLGYASEKEKESRNWLVNVENIYTRYYFCSGALINKHWVLTTARCVDKNGGSRLSVLLQPIKASDLSVKVWADMNSLVFDDQHKLAMFRLDEPVTDRDPVKLSYNDKKTRKCETLLCAYMERIAPNPPQKFRLEEHTGKMILTDSDYYHDRENMITASEVFCTVEPDGKQLGNKVVMGSVLTDCKGQLVGLGIHVGDLPSLVESEELEISPGFNAFLKLSAFKSFIERTKKKLPPGEEL
ncbi:trypsin-like serine protease [Endozoicomonas arenosclerae]|uniref:trypsin-like serine protease n=1 Tax=Endozoicomonas arenosclerae TaxID=1633495 RepID=UPI0007867213|nr:trypsin-like serine protease [Endozoicomonas arenosclerae]